MCQTCIGCGKCTGEARPPLAAGTCPSCGQANEGPATICSRCGFPLPAPPGRGTAPKNADNLTGHHELIDTGL